MTPIRLAAAMTLARAPAVAHDHGEVRINLDALDYRVSPTSELVETTVAYGDPEARGAIYATHARAREGAVIAPHTHPNTLTTWVTSGTVYVGVGEVFDEEALVAYPEGTFFVTEAGVPHFIAAAEGDFSVLDQGVGPGGIDFVEGPAD